MEDYLVLWVRLSSLFVEQKLIPEIERNCEKYGVFSQAACKVFQENKWAENSMYFHHQYAEKDIPMGQEYEAIAYSKGGKIQPDSIQKCHSKVLCFFTAFRTQPSDYAMRGHHELSLIQFEKEIPPMVKELVEIMEWESMDLTEQSYVYLGSEAGLRKLAHKQEMMDRIMKMEQYLDEVSEVWNHCPEEVSKNADLQKKVQELTQYLDGGLWLQDYEADERGELPVDLKRGVLSQDVLYNLLCEMEEAGRSEQSITVKEVDKTYFEIYDKIPMRVEVNSEYKIKRLDNGLGGVVFEECPVEPYVKDFGKYECATTYEEQFDISTWRFYMAFDGETAIGAATVAGPTRGMNMLYGREDACVLWDIRVADGYKHRGIGQSLFDMVVDGAKKDGYRQMVIECQNNNVPACHFYHKQGAVLCKVDMHAYYMEPEVRDEVQLVWYLDI